MRILLQKTRPNYLQMSCDAIPLRSDDDGGGDVSLANILHDAMGLHSHPCDANYPVDTVCAYDREVEEWNPRMTIPRN